MTEKISFHDLEDMLRDIDVPDEKIRPYLMVQRGTGPFDPVAVPNPETVDMSEAERDAASAMRIGNTYSRWRRQRRFKREAERNPLRPIIVDEGDSWHQFPIMVTDVVDHLAKQRLVCSISAAGDTAANMVHRRPEYMKTLLKHKERVKAFLFSGAGNDVIGEDEDEKPVLGKLLNQHDGGDDAERHINRGTLKPVLEGLENAYRELLKTVRSEPAFATLPVVFHGYDVPFAYPHPDKNSDLRDPLWAARDEWLGKPFHERGIEDPDLRRRILTILIGDLYGMLDRVKQSDAHVFVVDARGSLPSISDWVDEIHGTDEGFEKVAARFEDVLSNQAGVVA